MTRKTAIAVFAISACCLAFIASASLSEMPPLFSHKVHVETGADCKDCHQAQEASDLPVIDPAGCGNCHDPVDRWRINARPSLMPEAFPHKKHAEALECKECHKDTHQDATRSGKPVMEFSACAACHESNGIEIAAGDCNRCHGKQMRQDKPASHDAGWTLLHGKQARYDVFGEHGRDCTACHRQDACTSCHKTTQPKSHTALWRVRAHGVAAEFDRESCKTCHETGSCVTCHKNSRPLSHRGAWKSLHGVAGGMESQQRCAVCHGPSDCTTCHK